MEGNESLVKELEKMGIRRAIAMTVDVTKEADVQAAYKQVRCQCFKASTKYHADIIGVFRFATKLAQ